VELDWSTFLLEIVNFAALVWILKRFLYRPVLAVIAKRRAEIDASLADAAGMREQAETLQAQYQQRLVDWENEKEKARDGLHEEIADERERLTAALMKSLEQEREKARFLDRQREQEAARQAEQEAIRQSLAFTARLLGRLASPEVEQRLLALALDELDGLPEDKVAALREVTAGETPTLQICSAFELPATQRQTLEQRLTALLGTAPECHFQQVPELQAGLRIELGPWVMRANLRDELAFFAESGHGG